MLILKIMKKYILSLVVALLSSFIFGQERALPNTMLWKVTKEGVERPSYLFGTFHMLCKEDFLIKDKVSKALEKSGKMIMEINFSNPEELEKMQSFLMAEKPITDNFTEEEIEILEAGLKNHYGYDLNEVQNLSPMALYSMLSMKFFACSPDQLKMLDMELMQIALKNKKEIIGLEKVSDQVLAFEKYLKPRDLLKLVNEFETNKSATDKIKNYYKDEDLNNVAETMFNEDLMTKEQKSILLDQRNQSWMKILPELISGESVFIAVGAGHLVGDQGLIYQLKRNGFKVEPVMK